MVKNTVGFPVITSFQFLTFLLMDFIILYSVDWICIILTHFSDLLHDLSRLSKLCVKLCCSSLKKKYGESQNLSTLAMTSCDIPASTSSEIIIIYKKTDS